METVAKTVDDALVGRLRSVVEQVRLTRKITPGVNQGNGSDELGVVGQMFESLLYNEEESDRFFWPEAKGNPAMMENVIAFGEYYIADRK